MNRLTARSTLAGKCLKTFAQVLNCYAGTFPEPMSDGFHGGDALKVLKELNVAIEETVEIFQTDGQPLPIPKDAAIF